MKRTLGVVMGLGIVIGLAYVLLGGNTVTVINEPSPAATSTDAAPLPSPADLMEQATQKLIAEARAASSTEIELAKAEAANRVEKEMNLKIEREVRQRLSKTNTVALQNIEKELSF